MSRGSREISAAMICRPERSRPKQSLVIALAFAICLAGWLPAGLLRVAHAGVNQWTTLGPEGGLIVDLAIDPSNSSILYSAANNAGIFKSSDSGATWAPANSGLTIAAVTDIAINPTNPNTLYCAANSKVFKSTNAAADWTVPYSDPSGLPVSP